MRDHVITHVAEKHLALKRQHMRWYPSDFRWISGANLLTTFSSQQEFGLQFCRKYGSSLMWYLSR